MRKVFLYPILLPLICALSGDRAYGECWSPHRADSLRMVTLPEIVILKDGNYLVVGSFSHARNAENFNRILIRNFQNAYIGYYPANNKYYVYIYESPDLEFLKKVRIDMRKIPTFRDAWILSIPMNAIAVDNDVTPDSVVKRQAKVAERVSISETTSEPITSAQPTTIQDSDNESYNGVMSADSLPVSETVTPSVGRKRIINWSLHIMPFYRSSDFESENGTLNPENRVAGINYNEIGLYIRPELHLNTRKFSFWVKPRFNTDFNADAREIDNEDNYETEFYFQQLKAKWQLSKSVSIMGGRYVKLMGPSIFLNPSNPFFINPGRLNPKIEVRPMDLVELTYASRTNWSLSLIANVGEGENELFEEPFFDFDRTYGIHGEYFGESENIGFMASMDEAQRAHLGIYGQKNLTEALIVWVDGALNNKINRFYAKPGHSTGLLNYEMVNGDDNENLFFTGLAGASYTFEMGPTLQAEYFHNGKGYNDKQLDSFYRMIETSHLYTFDVTRDLSDLNLGRAINTGLPYIRTHYLFTQLGDTDVFDLFNYNIRYLYCFDDKSSQLSSLVEVNLFDNLELFGVVVKNFETHKTELNRLINSQIMVGLLIKF